MRDEKNKQKQVSLDLICFYRTRRVLSNYHDSNLQTRDRMEGESDSSVFILVLQFCVILELNENNSVNRNIFCFRFNFVT